MDTLYHVVLLNVYTYFNSVSPLHLHPSLLSFKISLSSNSAASSKPLLLYPSHKMRISPYYSPYTTNSQRDDVPLSIKDVTDVLSVIIKVLRSPSRHSLLPNVPISLPTTCCHPYFDPLPRATPALLICRLTHRPFSRTSFPCICIVWMGQT